MQYSGTIKELISQMLNLDETKLYELKEYKDSKTKKQNRYVWGLLGKIALAENGRRSKDDDVEIYCNALEEANIKYIVKPVEIEVYEMLKKSEKIRAIRILQTRIADGVKFYICKIYDGTSKFNTQEEYQFLQYLRDRATSCGIDPRTPEEVAREESWESVR
jgi:hypothetical protein